MALLVQGISYTYNSGSLLARKAAEGIELELKPGEILGLWGGNGAGKSTLLKLICGVLEAQAGTIAVDGYDWTDRHNRRLWPHPCRPVLMAVQYPENQLFGQNTRQDIAAGLQESGAEPDETTRKVDEIAGFFFGNEAEEILKRPPYTLSGGQKRCAALASVLVQESPYIMLDEPVEGLDADKSHSLSCILASLAREGKRGIIIASHRMDFLLPLCDRLAWMENGRIIACGELLTVLASIESSGGEMQGLTASRQVLYKLKNMGLVLPLEARSTVQAASEIVAAREGRARHV